jgi:hypothetical protein
MSYSSGGRLHPCAQRICQALWLAGYHRIMPSVDGDAGAAATFYPSSIEIEQHRGLGLDVVVDDRIGYVHEAGHAQFPG